MSPRPPKTARGWLLSVASAGALMPSCAAQHPDEPEDDERSADEGARHAYDAGAVPSDASYAPGTIVLYDAGVVVAPDGGPWADAGAPEPEYEPGVVVYDAGAVASDADVLVDDGDAGADAGHCDPAWATPLPDGGCAYWVGLVARSESE